MAALHGFEILGMRSFQGREGVGTQGTVFYNGEELGFWSNDGDGGMDRFEFPHDKLDQLVAEQCSDIAWDDGMGNVFDADLSMLLARLADLQDLEEQWEELDRGGAAMVVLTDRDTGESIAYGIRKLGDEDALAELAFESAVEMVSEYGLGDCRKDIYWCREQFDQGDLLIGCEEALEDIAAHRERMAKWR